MTPDCTWDKFEIFTCDILIWKLKKNQYQLRQDWYDISLYFMRKMHGQTTLKVTNFLSVEFNL